MLPIKMFVARYKDTEVYIAPSPTAQRSTKPRPVAGGVTKDFPPRTTRSEAERDLETLPASITEKWVQEREYKDADEATLDQLGADMQSARNNAPQIELGYRVNRQKR